MADYWMKLYIEILEDSKMATLPDRIWRRVIELFLIAKREGKQGHIPDTRQLAWILRMAPDDLDGDLSQITQTGIIIKEVGGWFIPKFQSRQGATPAKERMSEMRERNQKQQYYDNVTEQLRNVTQSTESELDNRVQSTEAETEQKQSDPTDLLQRVMEKNGVLVNNVSAIKALNEIAGMGATCEDLKNGIAWKQDHNDGRVLYASAVVSPTRTAMQIRLQSNGGSDNFKPFAPGADGRVNL